MNDLIKIEKTQIGAEVLNSVNSVVLTDSKSGKRDKEGGKGQMYFTNKLLDEVQNGRA